MYAIDMKKIKHAGDYVRYLALSAIERSQSGHPGIVLGCADLGVALYRYILRYTVDHPKWINRDRFVLSAGHGSMFLYALNYVAGYDYTLDDLANFRQLKSKTPGHPEHNITRGIETTTGPLGQGFANSVGIALEGKMLAARFNKDGFPLFDYNVYTLMGDGCTMEGVSYEAASIAGHLGLDNLIAIYDSNEITIDGSTDITLSEDVRKRYEALGWEVAECDGENVEDFYGKVTHLTKSKGKPKLLITRTTIGLGLDKLKGTHKIHGAPAGLDEIVYFLQNSHMRELFEKECGCDIVGDVAKLKECKQKMISERKPPLKSDEDIAFVRESQKENNDVYEQWESMFESYKEKYPKEFEDLSKYINFEIPKDTRAALINYKEDAPDATRNISGRVLNMCADAIPQIVGGSADLVGSTRATVKSSQYVTRNDFVGRNIAFGVREHGMGSIGNGLALNGTFIPFTSTFFTFFDYMKPPVRLAAIMKLKHLFVFTHDSIYVGEDGPTHEPIEHINSLRLLPGIYTLRPANDVETAFSYLFFLEAIEGPAVILGTRQTLSESAFNYQGDRNALYEDFKKGGYVFYQTEGAATPDVIIAASGSEVGTSVDAAKVLEGAGKKVRVVSMPCLERFQEQDDAYRASVIGDGTTPLVIVEALSHRGVCSFYGKNVLLLDIQVFGESGSYKKVAEHFGFTPEKIAEKTKDFIG